MVFVSLFLLLRWFVLFCFGKRFFCIHYGCGLEVLGAMDATPHILFDNIDVSFLIGIYTLCFCIHLS